MANDTYITHVISMQGMVHLIYRYSFPIIVAHKLSNPFTAEKRAAFTFNLHEFTLLVCMNRAQFMPQARPVMSVIAAICSVVSTYHQLNPQTSLASGMSDHWWHLNLHACGQIICQINVALNLVIFSTGCFTNSGSSSNS